MPQESRSFIWCVIKTRPNKEFLASKHLEQQGHKVLLPFRLVSVRHARKTVQKRKPLFPGYLFAALDVTLLRSVGSTRGVSHILTSCDRRPLEVQPNVIEELRARCSENGELLPPTQLQVGDTIRIVNGSFAGIMAKVEMVPDDGKVLVFLDLMGQKVKTLIASTHLEAM